MTVWHNGGSQNFTVVKDHGDCLVIRNRSYPPQLLESRRNDYAGEVLPRNRRNSPEVPTCVHWTKGRNQFCSMITLGRMLHNRPWGSWMNWAMRLCLIHHSRRPSRQLSTTFSSTSITFWVWNALKTHQFQSIVFLRNRHK